MPPEASFEMWRDHARRLLKHGVPPERVEWRVRSAQDDLFAEGEAVADVAAGAGGTVRRDCLGLLRRILCHTSEDRFALAYRVLWRSLRQPDLLRVATDPDIAAAGYLARQIRRDVHDMKSYVRFREKRSPGSNMRHFLAWYEPEHHILELVAPFFSGRFTDMNWLILTPKGSIAQDDAACVVTREVCVRETVEDETEQLWHTYYRSVFNPARIKLKAMRSEMPRRLWKNLPETDLIPEMLVAAQRRDFVP
nr:TIGR03915 family putative DNA repair protein [Acetobacter oeni]